MHKRAQSEIAGFAIIIVIISVLILVFLSFSLNKNSNKLTESAETENFVQTILQFTTNCERRGHFLDYLDLIKLCGENGVCADGKDACLILNSTSEEILRNVWKVGDEEVTKGYDFSVLYEGGELLHFVDGNKTKNNFGSRQVFSGGVEVVFVKCN